MPLPAAACVRTSSRSRPVDGLLLSGFTGEVWFEPGVTADEARRAARASDSSRRPSLAASGSCSARATSPRSRCSTCCTSCSRATASALLKLNPTQDALVRGLRARARAAHRARLRADRPRRRRRRRLPDPAPGDRPRAHHRRSPHVRRDRVGTVDGLGCGRDRAAQARGPPAAEEADHGRARRRLADHRRSRACGPTPTCSSRRSTSRRCGCRTPATTASPGRSC